MNVTAMAPVLMAGTGASWNLTTFLQKLQTNGQTWITAIFVIIGLVMVLVGVYKAAKKLIQGQAGAQISWVTVVLLIAIGAALTTIGVSGVIGLGQGVVDTVKDLGGTT